MTPFFLFLQFVCFYGLGIYVILKKGELSIFYLPALFFVEKIVGTLSPAFLYYGLISFIVLLLVVKNASLFRNNIFSFLLIVYFFALLTQAENLTLIRPFFFSVIWLFLLIAVIPSIYAKYSREEIFKELCNACFLILILFIANALVSTVYKFSPMGMYGITKGIMYGNLWAAAFNTLSTALFVVFLKGVTERRHMYVILTVVSMFFIMLTLRRTVMALSAFGIVVGMLTLMTQKKAKMVFVMMSLIVLTGYIIYTNTDFMQEFNERVELRKLDDRALAEEKRFIEYDLLYNDMFVYNAYSPWFGFGLFNSAGNYGNGFLGDRSLHGDIPNLLHSSGLIGVLLYLLMIGTAFAQAIKASKQYIDKLIILFCSGSFLVYTVTGRYTEIASTLLLFLVLMIPLAKDEPPAEETEV
ncbi:O-antigen ligase family protein [Longitalea arenae]|uniref:O-antigen ligase family protein n=1 Tax=Longitalea arenae TaxID=2812558 RepID=UPI0019685064|nr:O-antigen ligase family protein [Longitalea arenae]